MDSMAVRARENAPEGTRDSLLSDKVIQIQVTLVKVLFMDSLPFPPLSNERGR